MTLSTLVADSSKGNYANTKTAILAECEKTAKYSVLNQTSYIYENGVEKELYLTKADLTDRIVVLKVDKEKVSTFEPFIEPNEWAAMIKYLTGGTWDAIGSNEFWYSTTRFPEKSTIISPAAFYDKFLFSAGANPQITPLGRNILHYDPITDSFKRVKLSDWDGTSVVENSIMIPGCVEYTTLAEEVTKSQLRIRYPSLIVPDNGLMVFTGDNNKKYVMLGQETYRAWNTSGTQTIGYRAAFQVITDAEFIAKQIIVQ